MGNSELNAGRRCAATVPRGYCAIKEIIASWFKNCGEKYATELFPIRWSAVGQPPAEVVMGKGSGIDSVNLWLREVGGIEAGPPPPVDLAAERRNGDFVRALIADGLVTACHDVSDGGLGVALAEMAIQGGIGATVLSPEGTAAALPLHAWLFGEDQARCVLTTRDRETALARARKAGVPAAMLGTTGGDALTLPGGNAISLSKLRLSHEAWLPGYMG